MFLLKYFLQVSKPRSYNNFIVETFDKNKNKTITIPCYIYWIKRIGWMKPYQLIQFLNNSGFFFESETIFILNFIFEYLTEYLANNRSCRIYSSPVYLRFLFIFAKLLRSIEFDIEGSIKKQQFIFGQRFCKCAFPRVEAL